MNFNLSAGDSRVGSITILWGAIHCLYWFTHWHDKYLIKSKYSDILASDRGAFISTNDYTQAKLRDGELASIRRIHFYPGSTAPLFTMRNTIKRGTVRKLVTEGQSQTLGEGHELIGSSHSSRGNSYLFEIILS